MENDNDKEQQLVPAVQITITFIPSQGRVNVEGIPQDHIMYLGLLEMAKLVLLEQRLGKQAASPIMRPSIMPHLLR